MRQKVLIAITCALLASPLAAAAHRELTAGIELGSSQKVMIDFEIGELRIEARRTPRVEVELDLKVEMALTINQQMVDLEFHLESLDRQSLDQEDLVEMLEELVLEMNLLEQLILETVQEEATQVLQVYCLEIVES